MKSRDRELEFWDGFKRRNAFAACLQETWREDVGVTEERGFGTLVWGSPDAQKGRGSAGVAIALSPVAANAWESGGCKVFQAGNGRVVGVVRCVGISGCTSRTKLFDFFEEAVKKLLKNKKNLGESTV
jgi:hypothetical protein